MRISDWSSDVCSSDLIEVRTIALCGVRLVDPATARIAAVEDDLVDPTLLFPAHGAERDRILEFFEDDRLHTFELALLVRRKMIEFGFRSEERRVGKEVCSTCSFRW